MPRAHAFPACCLIASLLLATVQGTAAGQVRDIVVFDFEMMDSSAAAGIIPQDDLDTKYLGEATQVAKDQLRSAGAFQIIDVGPAATELAQAGALRHCNGCEVPIAAKLGGELAMTGIVNRISRTEFEMLIKVVDARTGAPVATGYTGLRMGANYAWPRGAKWLMEKRVLAGLSGK